MNAYILTRQSGRRDGGDSLEVQEEKARVFAAARELDVVDVVVGGNRSGNKAAWIATLRATLARAIDEGVSTIIVPWGTDRFVRNEQASADIIAAADAAGVELVTTSGDRLTFRTAEEWRRNREAAIRDEYDVRRTRERVAANKQRRIEAGKLVGPLPQLGYRSVPAPDGDGKIAEPVEEERELVLRLFRMFADGERDDAILEEARAAGHELTATSLKSMIASPIYIGRIAWGGRSYEGAHEGIVPLRLWERANSVRRPRGKRPRSTRLLAGLRVLVCAECGRALVVGSGGRRGENLETYTHPSNTECRASGAILARIAERAVLQHVALAIRELKGQSVEIPGVARELERAEERLAKLRRMAVLVEDEEGFADEYAQALEARDKLAGELADRAEVAGVTWKVGGTLLEPDFGNMPQDVLREVIRTVIDKVEVRSARDAGTSGEGRLTFHVRGAFDLGRLLDRAAGA